MFEQKLVTLVGTSLQGTGFRGLLSRTWCPGVEQLRYRNRVNFKRPLPLHFKRERMLRLVEPIYPDELKVCQIQVEKHEKLAPIQENPYGVFLAKCMREDFYKYPLIALFHTNNHNDHDYLRIRGIIFDSKFDMKLARRQNSKVIELALRGTKFEPVLRLTPCQVSIGYCADKKVDKLLQVAKKMPQFILLGAVMDNRLMHRADLEAYASMNMDTARAQFCHTLNSAGVALSRNLSANALHLSHSLGTYAKGESTDGGGKSLDSPAPAAEETAT